MRRNDLPLGIIGVGLKAQANCSTIRFVVSQQIFADARGLAEAHDEHTRRHGIECAGVADLPHFSRMPHPRHHPVT